MQITLALENSEEVRVLEYVVLVPIATIIISFIGSYVNVANDQTASKS